MILCLQYELLNVSANGMIGKMTLYTDGRNRVSHQCELSYEFSEFLIWQMILCIWYNLLISWYSALSNFVARCRNLLKTLCSATHQLLFLICLEFWKIPICSSCFSTQPESGSSGAFASSTESRGGITSSATIPKLASHLEER